MSTRISYVDSLPESVESCINGVIEGLARKDPVVEQWISSLEAPSAIAVVREVFPDVVIHIEEIPEPDPRIPRRKVFAQLWRYEGERGIPAVEEPAGSILEAVCALAQRDYALDSWSAAAKTIAGGVGATTAEWLAAAVHPLPRRNRIAPWEWRFRWQIAAMLLAAHAEEKGGSDPLAVLGDIVYGPADWTTTAAIIAILDLARRQPERAGEFVRFFLDVVKAPDTPVWFMCAAFPALVACRDIPGLPANLCETLDKKIADWSD